MRLGIVLDRFHRDRGGTERYLAGLSSRLAARGHEVRVYCASGTAPAPGVAIVPIAARAWPRAARERELAERSCERARRDRCAPLLAVRHVLDADVWQPHGGTWATSAQARLRAEPSPIRRALRAAAHRVSKKHRWFLEAERELLARRPGLLTLAVSPLVRDDVLERHGGLASRVEVVWPAIELAPLEAAAAPAARATKRRELGVRERAPLLAFLAHDFELKGLRHAIEAFARCEARRTGAVLLVAGRGPSARYDALARRLGVADRVRFVGAREDAAALLGASDLLVHPTHHDPCALVTLEALGAGVPVVTTRRNGASALLENGAGRVVDDPGAVEAMAGAIDALLVDREAPVAARAAARELDWEQHLGRIVPLLEGAAAGVPLGAVSRG